MSASDFPCPCGSTTAYADCCQPYHQQQKTAATPELLMRSRYTAFALNHLVYLQDTWHPDTCPVDLNLQANPQWVKLEVLSAGIQKYPRHHLGYVHFRAICRDQEDNQLLLDERSRFKKVGGQWLYVDGESTFNPLD